MSSSADRHRFVNQVGDLLATWNLPRATGRTYAYLLLQSEPSTSEELQRVLELSSGSVSTAIRELVSWGLAGTISQPGSRRLLIEAQGGFEQLLAASHERSRAFIRTLQSGESLIEDDRARERLRDVTRLFTSYVDAGDRALHDGRPT